MKLFKTRTKNTELETNSGTKIQLFEIKNQHETDDAKPLTAKNNCKIRIINNALHFLKRVTGKK